MSGRIERRSGNLQPGLTKAQVAAAVRMLLVALLAVGVPSLADPVDDVVATHAAWRDALLAGDGSAAWSHVSRRTRTFCEEVLGHAWRADRNALSALSVTAMILVIQARTKIPREELLALNGEGFFYLAVRHGWLVSGLLEGQSIEDIRVDGDAATGVQRIGEQVYPAPLQFRLESEAWRVDMAASIATTNQAFQRQARASGMSAIELVWDLLETQNGGPLSPDALKPLL